MSLSFVSSAVQTGTSDGGYEETPIESQQVQEVNRRNAHQPLFEQLRQNQEEEQAKQEDLQREMMRGTRALDEDDVAHLAALDQQRRDREDEIQQQTRQELALFRAAKAERQQIVLEEDGDDEETDQGSSLVVDASKTTTSTKKRPQAATIVSPKIVVKKRKRKVDIQAKGGPSIPTGTVSNNNDEKIKTPGDDENETSTKPVASGLGGLLSGYGSSDSESD